VRNILQNPLAVKRNNEFLSLWLNSFTEEITKYVKQKKINVLRRYLKITISRHSKLSNLEHEILRKRAIPRASYPGLQNRTYSRIENIHTHIL